MTMQRTLFLLAAAACSAVAGYAAAPWKEARCVTLERLRALDPGLKETGRLAVRDARDIRSSNWSIGCETMDRDYADWDKFKRFLAPLGAKRGRLFSGWAKTEKKKGVYDFSWLDPQVREMAAMGIKPWICLAYGNPIYGSELNLGTRVRQVTGNETAFGAWLRYCAVCVERYKDVVDEWEIWNEPFEQGPEYAELFYRTAKTVRAVQPEAKCLCTAITFPTDYVCVLEKLKKEFALGLGSGFIYHPYDANPDGTYAATAEPLRALVKSYSPAFDIVQGEVGCPTQLEFAHALANIEWSEYAQAKWLLRRTIGDAVRSIPSSVFTAIDLRYSFMLQSFGLVRASAAKRPVYRRPSYYAMQNVFSLLDCDARPCGVETNAAFALERRADPRDAAKRVLTCATFERAGKSLRFYWFSEARPSSLLEFDVVTLAIPGRVERPAWVEMATGRVFDVPERSVRREDGSTVLSSVPMWDCPVLIAERGSFPEAVKPKAD